MDVPGTGLERLAVAGLSLGRSDLESLQRLGEETGARGSLLARELADALGASELVLVQTCNRIEVAFAREEGPSPGNEDLATLARELTGDAAVEELEAALHLFQSTEAVRYLFRVAASLESLVVGEDQILAQLREAFEEAEANGLTGPLLAPVFRRAFQVGKLVRTRTDLSRHPISVVSLAVGEVVTRAGNRRLRAGILGAGKMARLIAQACVEAKIDIDFIANRTEARAAELAAEFDARTIPLADVVDAQTGIDALFSATSAPGVVLSTADLVRLATAAPDGKLFAADVALPRDLEPTDDERVELVDLAALEAAADENRARRREAAREAEQIVEERARTFSERASDAAVSAGIRHLREGAAEIERRELAKLSEGRFAALDEADRRALERWASAAFGRLGHQAIDELKRLANDLDPLDGHGEDA